jgi:hypothetical protein
VRGVTDIGARLAEVGRALAPNPDAEIAHAASELRLALDPAYARQMAREIDHRKNYGRRRKADGRNSGWQHGTPQCPSCRRILSQQNGWCPDCRMYGSSGHDHGR